MHAVIAKRIIRHKENQIRRGGKCTPGKTLVFGRGECESKGRPTHRHRGDGGEGFTLGPAFFADKTKRQL